MDVSQFEFSNISEIQWALYLKMVNESFIIKRVRSNCLFVSDRVVVLVGGYPMPHSMWTYNAPYILEIERPAGPRSLGDLWCNPQFDDGGFSVDEFFDERKSIGFIRNGQDRARFIGGGEFPFSLNQAPNDLAIHTANSLCDVLYGPTLAQLASLYGIVLGETLEVSE